MQGPIYCTILQVDGDRVDGIRDFLGARGSINACNRLRSGGSGSSNRWDTV